MQNLVTLKIIIAIIVEASGTVLIRAVGARKQLPRHTVFLWAHRRWWAIFQLKNSLYLMAIRLTNLIPIYWVVNLKTRDVNLFTKLTGNLFVIDIKFPGQNFLSSAPPGKYWVSLSKDLEWYGCRSSVRWFESGVEGGELSTNCDHQPTPLSLISLTHGGGGGCVHLQSVFIWVISPSPHPFTPPVSSCRSLSATVQTKQLFVGLPSSISPSLLSGYKYPSICCWGG